jgi:pimeloyl-ACP methyl ester carboxylesterase
VPSSPTSDPTTTETPFFFEVGERPVYAVFHAARRARAGARAVVLCSSLAVEQLTCYRNEVLLARALAERGIPVLRYHPRGHGDSGGDWADVTLESLVADARAAAGVARERSGLGGLAFVGVRFGALAAAGAAVASDPSAPLALWEPVQRADDYFRSWLRGVLFSAVAHGERPKETVDDFMARLDRDGAVDVHGYYLHRALFRSSGGHALVAMLEGWKSRALIVQIQGRTRLAAPHAACAEALAARGSAVETALVNEEQGWHFLQNPAWESPALLRRTVEWFDALA